jgi:hypothetical protein
MSRFVNSTVAGVRTMTRLAGLALGLVSVKDPDAGAEVEVLGGHC